MSGQQYIQAIFGICQIRVELNKSAKISEVENQHQRYQIWPFKKISKRHKG